MKKHTIENVLSYSVGSKDIVMVKDDRIILNNQEIFRGKGQLVASFVKPNILVYGNSEKQFVAKDQIETIEINESLFLRTLLNDEAIGFDNFRFIENRAARDYFLYSFKEKTKNYFWRNGELIIGELLENQTLIAVDIPGIIFRISIPTETTLWQYDTSVLGLERVEKIFGVFGKVLVVAAEYTHEQPPLQPQKMERLFGLDIETGQCLWQTDRVLENGESSVFGGMWSNLKSKKNSLLLRGLQGDFYFELDSQNGDFKAVSIKDQLETIGIGRTDTGDISETHIYFKASVMKWAYVAKAVGSLNLETKTIDWHYLFDELKESETFIQMGQPKAAANKIYALDTANTLHIFERE